MHILHANLCRLSNCQVTIVRTAPSKTITASCSAASVERFLGHAPSNFAFGQKKTVVACQPNLSISQRCRYAVTELRLMVDRWTVLAALPVRFGECDQPSAKSGSKKSCNYLELELESLSFTGSANWKLIYAARAQLYPRVGFRVLILPSFTQETRDWVHFVSLW